jgi:transmembrane sensor
MRSIFHISKLFIKKKLKVLSNSEKLELTEFYTQYSFLNEIKLKKLVDKIESYKAIDNAKAWEAIETKCQKRNSKPVIQFISKNWYKYAAVLIIGGLLTTLYFANNLKPKNSIDTHPIIANQSIKTIQPGTDKATLTLEDGTVVQLSKGNNFKTNSANSNGEEIVYVVSNPNRANAKKLSYNYLTIPRGGQFHLVLADGTAVWLNSETQLRYPVAFQEGNTRQVELVYGEAYFEVSPSTAHKGARFVVLNKKQEVEVVGTKFNIKAYKDEFNIYTTLVEGKVDVKIGTQKQRLIPNQQLNLDLNSSKTQIQTVDVNSIIAWKDGVFSFKGKTLKEIMKVIGRWYDVDVVFENKKLETLTFKGSIEKKQPIEEILSIMKSNTINSYEYKNKTLTLK